MKRRYLTIPLVLILWVQMPARAGDDKNTVAAALQSATVYRTGAELVHTATARLVSGNNELLITGLSNSVDINSIRIGGTGDINILAVEFSTDYLKPATESALVRKLKDSINSVNREIARLQALIKTDDQLLDLLEANKSMSGTQTGVSVAELMKMMDYYKSRSVAIREEALQYREKEKKWEEGVAQLQNQVREEAQKNSKTGGRLLLRLLSPLPGTYTFTISYLTSKAYWNPCYDFRVARVNEPMQVDYKAKLVQTTGLDWKQVKLSLATAAPNRNHTAPELKTWFLVYEDPDPSGGAIRLRGLGSEPPGARGAAALDEVVVVGYGTKKGNEDQETPEPIYVINGNIVPASEYFKLDKRAIKSKVVLSDDKAKELYGSRGAGGVTMVTLKDGVGDYVSVNDKELDIVYHLDVPYDVPGNGKEQTVALKAASVPVDYEYYTVPKLDKSAYLLAKVPGWEQLNLLPGEANIIFEGTYTGKTNIDPQSTKDTLLLTLGADKRVVITREKLKDYSSVRFLGGNKKQVFTYEITVKNNKKEKIDMRLQDQYPLPTNKDVDVELLESSGATVNKDTGELSWKLELAPGAAQKFRISYSVRYPKEKILNLE